MNRINSSRKKREAVKRKSGNFLIITDGTKTEVNYLKGLISTLNEEESDVKIITARTHELLKKCIKEREKSPEYREAWIIFDRDQVVDFDDLIDRAKREGIKVAWSNPCIETWFSSYFGKPLNNTDSKTSCARFGELFKKKTGRKYHKNDEQIYELLNRFGNEDDAVKRTKSRHKQFKENGYKNPSEMISGTTFFELVEDIKN